MSQTFSVSTPSPIPNNADIAALAQKLRETADALLALSRNTSNGSDGHTSPPESGSVVSKPPCAIRSYAIPSSIAQDEQELLAKTNAHDLREALSKIYGHIKSIVHLMQQYDSEEKMSGVVLHDLSEVLSVPLEWLEMLCSIVTEFRFVQPIETE